MIQEIYIIDDDKYSLQDLKQLFVDNDEYKFVGWYKDGEKFDFNTPIKKNINLEAKWEKKEK